MRKIPSAPKMDKKWQAECDVHTLMLAQEIKADAARMRAAKAAAQEQAKQAAKVAQTMAKKVKR